MKRIICLVAVLLLAGVVALGCQNLANKTGAASNAAGPAATDVKKLPDDEVVAWVNNVPIPRKSLEDLINRMPPMMKPQLLNAEGLKSIVGNVVDVEVVYQEALKDGYMKKPDVVEKIDQLTRQLVFGEYMAAATKDMKTPDEAAIKKFYDSTPQLANQKFDEVKDKIAQYLSQQAQQEAMVKVVNDLKAKMTVKMNDKVVNDITQKAIASAPPMPQGMMGGPGGGMGGPPPAAMQGGQGAAPAAPAKPAAPKKPAAGTK
jgi:hypothetical protein